MREYTVYIWLGIWLVILPFLGVPGSWKERLVALTGLAVIGVVLYRQYRSAPADEKNPLIPNEAMASKGEQEAAILR